MDYKKMWLALKKTVEEESNISDKLKFTITGELDYFDAQAKEADYILREMKFLEANEMLAEADEEDKNDRDGD